MIQPYTTTFAFVYGDDNALRQTQVQYGNICPWCELDCLTQCGLMLHLHLCHDRFEYECCRPSDVDFQVTVSPTGRFRDRHRRRRTERRSLVRTANLKCRMTAVLPVVPVPVAPEIGGASAAVPAAGIAEEIGGDDTDMYGLTDLHPAGNANCVVETASGGPAPESSEDEVELIVEESPEPPPAPAPAPATPCAKVVLTVVTADVFRKAEARAALHGIRDFIYRTTRPSRRAGRDGGARSVFTDHAALFTLSEPAEESIAVVASTSGPKQ